MVFRSSGGGGTEMMWLGELATRLELWRVTEESLVANRVERRPEDATTLLDPQGIEFRGRMFVLKMSMECE